MLRSDIVLTWVPVNVSCPFSPLLACGIFLSVLGNFLVVLWLRLHTFTAEGAGSVPGWGAKIHTFLVSWLWLSCLVWSPLLLLLSHFSRVWLCDPIDSSSPPGSPVPGILLQARTLEWVAISFSTAWKWKVKVKSLSWVQLLANPMDCSPPGSFVHGIFPGNDHH